MAGRTAVVTGAGKGIGLELVKALQACGWHVLATCRQCSEALQQLREQDGISVLEGVDFGQRDGCAALAAVPESRVDLVICNAGTLTNDTLASLDFDDCRHQFEVNALGPLRTVHALLDKLQEGSKVVVIGSQLGSVGKNESGNRYGYRMSKAAAHMAARNLACDLRPRGVAVCTIHPGVVISDMTRTSGSRATVTAAESAAGILRRVDGLTMATSGCFVDYEGAALPA